MSSPKKAVESTSPSVEDEEMPDQQKPASRFADIPVTWTEIYADESFMGGFPGGPEAVPSKVVNAILENPQEVRRVMLERLRTYRERTEQEITAPPRPAPKMGGSEERDP